jgi:hypothetical protein
LLVFFKQADKATQRIGCARQLRGSSDPAGLGENVLKNLNPTKVEAAAAYQI